MFLKRKYILFHNHETKGVFLSELILFLFKREIPPLKILISFHPYPSNLLVRFKLRLKYQERKEKEKMTSDSIAPTSNAVHLRRISAHPLPTRRWRITLMSPPESHHSLVMSLCGFIKGEGQSSCHSACKNREERRGSNRTPGKLWPK